MRRKIFQIKIKLFMYRVQDFGWMDTIKIACDLYDIMMWLIQ